MFKLKYLYLQKLASMLQKNVTWKYNSFKHDFLTYVGIKPAQFCKIKQVVNTGIIIQKSKSLERLSQ